MRSPDAGTFACLYASAMSLLSSLCDRLALLVARSDVVDVRANQAVVLQLFLDVCSPSGHARACKDVREQIERNAECVVNGCTEEVDVRINLLTLLVHLFAHCRLNCFGDV